MVIVRWPDGRELDLTPPPLDGTLAALDAVTVLASATLPAIGRLITARGVLKAAQTQPDHAAITRRALREAADAAGQLEQIVEKLQRLALGQ